MFMRVCCPAECEANNTPGYIVTNVGWTGVLLGACLLPSAVACVVHREDFANSLKQGSRTRLNALV